MEDDAHQQRHPAKHKQHHLHRSKPQRRRQRHRLSSFPHHFLSCARARVYLHIWLFFGRYYQLFNRVAVLFRSTSGRWQHDSHQVCRYRFVGCIPWH